jgi:hypothetical protein
MTELNGDLDEDGKLREDGIEYRVEAQSILSKSNRQGKGIKHEDEHDDDDLKT